MRNLVDDFRKQDATHWQDGGRETTQKIEYYAHMMGISGIDISVVAFLMLHHIALHVWICRRTGGGR